MSYKKVGSGSFPFDRIERELCGVVFPSDHRLGADRLLRCVRLLHPETPVWPFLTGVTRRAYGIWENIQHFFDEKIKKSGVKVLLSPAVSP